jgi:hypothetical protein
MMQDLVDFSERFGLTYNGPPSHIAPREMEEFRSNCMYEEVEEYDTARTIDHKLDALIDLIYFALGTAYLHGFAPIFYEAWRRVHAANMRKVRSPASEESTARGSAFDVVKPPGFVPPDLSDLTSDWTSSDGVQWHPPARR